MIRLPTARVFTYVRAETVQRRLALVRDAREVIARRFDEPDLALASVAREIATSRRQLQRALAEAGTTFSRELQRIRMLRAAQLLSDGSAPVHAVASAVGYRQAPQFAKVFRGHHGSAPSRFRRSGDSLAV